jgi:hypothetical protein
VMHCPLSSSAMLSSCGKRQRRTNPSSPVDASKSPLPPPHEQLHTQPSCALLKSPRLHPSLAQNSKLPSSNAAASVPSRDQDRLFASPWSSLRVSLPICWRNEDMNRNRCMQMYKNTRAQVNASVSGLQRRVLKLLRVDGRCKCIVT